MMWEVFYGKIKTGLVRADDKRQAIVAAIGQCQDATVLPSNLLYHLNGQQIDPKQVFVSNAHQHKYRHML
jgi:hypothetical protein